MTRWLPRSAALHCRRGTAAVEFALLAPLLIGILAAFTDFGIGAYRHMQVVDAAEAGAQFAVRQGYNGAAIQTAAAGATSLPSISTSSAQFCGCPSGTALDAVGCGTTCPGGGAAGDYVTVSVQTQYAPLLPYPGITTPLTLSAQSTVRLQ